LKILIDVGPRRCTRPAEYWPPCKAWV